MRTWLWVLTGILLYSVLAMWLRQQGFLPDAAKIQGPLLTLHTKRGRAFLNWLAGPKRFWRAWTNVGLGAALVIMVGTFLVLLQNAVSIVRNPPAPTAINNPQNVLVIPGVNRFLPLSVAPEIVLGLLIGLVVHEGGHGLLCRVGDIDIESMGLVLFTLLPIGAFVEPDETSQRRADRGARARMFAAGVTNNFVVTFLAFALLVGPVVGSIAVAPGAAVGAVYPGSAAAEAGIDQGDRIVAVAGHDIESNADLDRTLAGINDSEVRVSLASGKTVTVTRSLLVTRMATTSPFAGEGDAGIDVNETVVAVNGTAVDTESELRAALIDRTFATLTVVDRNGTRTTVTGPTGVLTTATEREADPFPMAQAGFPTDDTFVLVSVDGQRTLTPADVSAALDDEAPGETVRVVAYVDGQRRVENVTLTSVQGSNQGFIGVSESMPYSGVVVDSFGVTTYPAGEFLSLLSGGAGSLFQRAIFVLLLPFIGTLGFGFEFNFAGFVGWNTNFYQVTGPLGFLGGLVFLLANVLFWTGWINLNLAFFNCIPAYPLDGGRILRAGTEAVVARLPVENRHELTRAITTSIGLAMGLCLLLVLFGPQLLN